ncbi:O-acetylserine/cysteine export protein [compost metagenome]
MKARHLLLALSITAIWGVNFSVIKLGFSSVDPFILAGIRFTLCALQGAASLAVETLSLKTSRSP